MLALVLRTTEFVFYHVLLSLVDRASRLPRDTTVPEAMRLNRENFALKAQLDALERHLVLLQKGRRKGAARERCGCERRRSSRTCSHAGTSPPSATSFRRRSSRFCAGQEDDVPTIPRGSQNLAGSYAVLH
jgi:hypothetical protein